MLGPYRVLDLTNQRGLLCGQILADLGADVIQIEPPGGSPARRLGPFAGDVVDPERSLFWWAYARNKRGITLDLTRGRDLFERPASVQPVAHQPAHAVVPAFVGRLEAPAAFGQQQQHLAQAMQLQRSGGGSVKLR